MNNKSILNTILICCFLLSAFCVFYYFTTFHQLPVSKKTSDWSNFGSYIAGTVGPLLSLVSILFILKSINSSNENHEAIMAFSKNDKIVNQIKDLSDSLKQSLISSFIFQSKPGHQPYSEIICSRIEQMIPIRGELTIEEVAKSATREGFNVFKSEIKLIMKILSLLECLNQADQEVYKTMLEVKLSNSERAVLYCFACKDSSEEAATIHRKWPTFRSFFFDE